MFAYFSALRTDFPSFCIFPSLPGCAVNIQAGRRRGPRRCKLCSVAWTLLIRHRPCCGQTDADRHRHRHCLTTRVAYSLQGRVSVVAYVCIDCVISNILQFKFLL